MLHGYLSPIYTRDRFYSYRVIPSATNSSKLLNLVPLYAFWIILPGAFILFYRNYKENQWFSFNDFVAYTILIFDIYVIVAKVFCSYIIGGDVYKNRIVPIEQAYDKMPEYLKKQYKDLLLDAYEIGERIGIVWKWNNSKKAFYLDKIHELFIAGEWNPSVKELDTNMSLRFRLEQEIMEKRENAYQ